jgi:hypothetical protein
MLTLLLTLACMPEKPDTDDGDGDGSPTGEDCNDADPSIHPGAEETCNRVDDDCDGEVDEDPSDGELFWLDEDGDGFGTDEGELAACSRPEGYALQPGDCDDTTTSVYPDAEEICDYADNDCDGETDEEGKTLFYADADEDGFGDADDEGALDCGVSQGFSSNALDCDDSRDDVNPEAPEVCDGVDNDCDEQADEDAVDAEIWYQDRDEDGYGAEGAEIEACEAPDGYVEDGGDCDDGSATVHPYADEYCNEIDDDCDGRADESDALDTTTFYRDQDADGYGVDSTVLDACELPTGYAEIGGDCDDFDSSQHPDADEHCDGVDEDCDGVLDNDPVDPETWYIDADGDGWGSSAATTEACDQPSGYVSTSTDCDDGDGDVYPLADEYCNGVDDDCDGRLDEGTALDADTWYADADADGYGDSSRTQRSCDEPSGFVSDDTDCDDSEASVFPGADETCNSVDDDCDGDVDEDGIDAPTWYEDSDGDSYGGSASVQACDQPSGYEASFEDCDDADASVNPGAAEICGDGVDNDCDSSTLACGIHGTHQLSKELELRGASSGALFGASVASGDFDGDGFSDLLVGATDEAPYGQAYVFLGPVTADAKADDADLAIAGSYDGTASAVAALGDLDGDGIDDFAVGNDGFLDDGTADVGGVWVFYGPASGASDVYDADETWLGQLEGQAAGGALAGIGDQDGDGLAELIDGAAGWSTAAAGGQAVLRSAGDASSSSGPGLFSSTTGDELGSAVLGADLDSDGTEDLIVGAPGADSKGSAYVQYGPVTSQVASSSADLELQGASASEAGSALAVGDLDGDGHLDLLVGAPETASRGDAFVLMGPLTNGGALTSVADARVKGSSGSRAGSALVACDVDGDGRDEAIVGAPGMGSGKGKSYLFSGLTSGTLTMTSDMDATLSGVATGDASGSGLACGDTDADGYEDLWVASPAADSKGSDAGSVYLLTGGAGL